MNCSHELSAANSVFHIVKSFEFICFGSAYLKIQCEDLGESFLMSTESLESASIQRSVAVFRTFEYHHLPRVFEDIA